MMASHSRASLGNLTNKKEVKMVYEAIQNDGRTWTNDSHAPLVDGHTILSVICTVLFSLLFVNSVDMSIQVTLVQEPPRALITLELPLATILN